MATTTAAVIVFLISCIHVGYAKESRTTNDPTTSKKNPYILAGKFEGDIAGVSGIDQIAKDVARNAVRDRGRTWKGKVVPYVITPGDFSSEEQGQILNAIKAIEDNSCVKFREKTKDDANYVRILKEIGCHSEIGVVGGPQILSLDTACFEVTSYSWSNEGRRIQRTWVYK